MLDSSRGNHSRRNGSTRQPDPQGRAPSASPARPADPAPQRSPRELLRGVPGAKAVIDELLAEVSLLQTPDERLAWALRQENLAELSQLVGKDRSTLANYRLRRRQPDLETLAAICRATGISADWILGLQEDPWVS